MRPLEYANWALSLLEDLIKLDINPISVLLFFSSAKTTTSVKIDKKRMIMWFRRQLMQRFSVVTFFA